MCKSVLLGLHASRMMLVPLAVVEQLLLKSHHLTYHSITGEAFMVFIEI